MNAIRRVVCALANDLPNHGEPGVVFLGVRDDGACAGLEVTDQLLTRVSELRGDGSILPFPVMTVQHKRLDDCDVAVVEVQPSESPPVHFNGRCWVRVGPTTRGATADEERRLVEKRRWANLPFDQQPAGGLTIDDLDLDFFRREYLPASVSSDVLDENTRTDIDQLAALRLLARDGGPTNAAVLVLGNDPRRWLPGAYIQFVRFDGTVTTDPIKDQKEVSGTLAEQLSSIDAVFRAHISVAADLSASRETRIPDYPIIALQEVVRNAVIHRSYESSHSPVRVSWFSDRVEILSPGGPFGLVGPDNFGRPGLTDYRNPTIAEAAKNLGFAQRFGIGLARAQEALESNGNPPLEFEVGPEYILVRIRPRR
jgi:ATP-dependent DNA helicase RecG